MLAFVKLFSVMVEMCVVVTESSAVVEQIKGIAARLAQEQLCDGTVHDSMDRRTARFHDVDGLVPRRASHLIKGVVKVVGSEAAIGGAMSLGTAIA